MCVYLDRRKSWTVGILFCFVLYFCGARGEGMDGLDVLRRYAAVKEQVAAEREEQVARRCREIVGAGMGSSSLLSTPARYRSSLPASTSFPTRHATPFAGAPRSSGTSASMTAMRASMPSSFRVAGELRDTGIGMDGTETHRVTPSMQTATAVAAAELADAQMRRMAIRIEELELEIAEGDGERDRRTRERFEKISHEIVGAVNLVQQLQLHIFPKFASTSEHSGSAREPHVGADGFTDGAGGSVRSEQRAHAELERLLRAIAMLRMIIDAKLETMQTLRSQMQKEADEANFMLREERRAAAEAREAFAKLEASTWQEREALRQDVDALKGMYEEELGRFRSRIDDAESVAAASQAKLTATEQHVRRLSDMFDEEQSRREMVEREYISEQQAHHECVVRVRMLEQEREGLRAELMHLREAFEEVQVHQGGGGNSSGAAAANPVEKTAFGAAAAVAATAAASTDTR